MPAVIMSRRNIHCDAATELAAHLSKYNVCSGPSDDVSPGEPTAMDAWMRPIRTADRDGPELKPRDPGHGRC